MFVQLIALNHYLLFSLDILSSGIFSLRLGIRTATVFRFHTLTDIDLTLKCSKNLWFFFPSLLFSDNFCSLFCAFTEQRERSPPLTCWQLYSPKATKAGCLVFSSARAPCWLMLDLSTRTARFLCVKLDSSCLIPSLCLGMFLFLLGSWTLHFPLFKFQSDLFSILLSGFLSPSAPSFAFSANLLRAHSVPSSRSLIMMRNAIELTFPGPVFLLECCLQFSQLCPGFLLN